MEKPEKIESEVVSLLADRAAIDWKRLVSLRPEDGPYLHKLKALETIIRANGRLFETTGTAILPVTPVSQVPPDAKRPGARSETGDTGELVLKKWGRLEILELLGRGSFGEVFKAHDTVLQRVVALKLRRPDDGMEGDAERRFLKEARRLAKIRHENVVAVHGADVHNGRIGLWTDYLPGRTLEETVKSQGPYGYREAVLIGMDLCRALAAVHAAGLVHRDIKPANVLKTDDGRTMLLDFGAATRDLNREPGAEASGPMGTLLYIAPENLLGEPATPQGDIYSLGVLLFRLVTGQYPVSAQGVFDMAQKHASGSRLSLRELRPDIPFSFVEAVDRATAIRPGDRYASVAEMERGLARVMTWVETPKGKRKESRTRTAVVSAVIGAVAIVLMVFLGRAWMAGSPEMALFRESSAGVHELGTPAYVQPGDRISLTYRSGRKSYLYAIDEDTDGQVSRLFPLDGLQPKNPLPANITHRIPGDRNGVEQKWTIGPDESGETILVMASSKPLHDVETMLATVPMASPVNLRPESLADSGTVNTDRTALAFKKAISHYAPAGDQTSFLDLIERNARQGDTKVVIRRFDLSKAANLQRLEKP